MTHKPQRFQVYTQLSNGKGFKIPGNDHIFLFTKQGGWYDQENNYYNSSGDPSQPHSEEDNQSQSEDSRSRRSESYDEYGQSDQDFYEDIVNQYKYDNNYEEHDYNYNAEDLKNMEKIANNQQILTNYPNNKALRVYYRNMDFTYPAYKIKEAYEKFAKILSVQQTQDHNNRKSEGYFILPNREQAKKLVEQEGKVVVSDRKVYFSVENIEQLIVDPISSNIWKTHNNSNGNNAKVQQKQKVKEKEKPKQKESIAQKQAPKQVQKQVLATKSSEQNQLQQQRYRFDIAAFGQANNFKEWMKQNGLEFGKDYKDLKKKTLNNNNKEEFGLVTMTNKGYKLISNGQKYKDKEIVFSLFQQ